MIPRAALDFDTNAIVFGENDPSIAGNPVAHLQTKTKETRSAPVKILTWSFQPFLVATGQKLALLVALMWKPARIVLGKSRHRTAEFQKAPEWASL